MKSGRDTGHALRALVAAASLTALGILAVVSPSSGAAQSTELHRLAVRVHGATHVAGLTLSSTMDSYGWRHRMDRSVGAGVTVAWGRPGRDWGFRVDADLLPDVHLAADPDGPALGSEESPAAFWATGSGWARPWSCDRVCAEFAAGLGAGRFEFRQSELRGHIVTPVSARQTVPTLRLGLDLSVPAVTRRVSLQIADNVAFVRPYYEAERLSPMHILSVGLAVGY